MAGKVSEGLISTIGSADGTLFAANPGRTFLSITNTHASQVLTVRFGTGAATATLGVTIAAGVTKQWGDNNTRSVPGSEIHVFGSGSATTLYGFQHDGNLMA